MAITRSQQAKQMLQDGGMLVQPGFGGTRQGYRGDAAAASGAPGYADTGPAGDPTEGGPTGAPSRGVLEAKQAFAAARKGLTKSLTQQSRQAALDKALSFLPGGKRSIIGLGLRGLNKAFGPKDLGIRSGYNMANIAGPTTTEEEDEQGQGEEDNVYVPPTFAQTQAPAGLPAAVMPMQTMDLNRIAYRLMADGGFIDDEPRQAYGLGSIVKKAFKKATTIPRKFIKTVKKVAKSPTGRLLLAVAAPYALGPAVGGSQFLAGLSAAQKAAVISGATTGITQLASGEDLDLKDIAISAAIGGASAKAFPPGGSSRAVSQAPRGPAELGMTTRGAIGTPGFKSSLVDEVALTGGRTFTGPAELGLSAQRAAKESALAQSLKPTAFTGADAAREARSVLSTLTPTPEKTGILQTLSDKITGNKLGNLLLGSKEGGISPMKSILLASTLAGLAAKKDYEEDEFSDTDRGPKIDIAAIRRRPFDYMAPRFAGSQFDFYDTAAADGGRIGYDAAGAVLSKKEMKKISKSPLYKGFKKMYGVDPQMAKDNPSYKGKFDMFEQIYKQNFQKGGKAEPVAKKVMPLLDMGGQEMDLRDNGGFVPIGRMEKADDVPARLSKNEFVFTADAVRNAGDGDVDKGAEVMYNMMKNLEAGGDVSEESQGLKGARRMFQTSQRLEEVL